VFPACFLLGANRIVIAPSTVLDGKGRVLHNRRIVDTSLETLEKMRFV
jgi:hypothetical protein